jgi:hypothetical protein
MPKKNKNNVATSSQIAKITGLEDHGYISAILSLGPTVEEVRVAFQCIDCAEDRSSLNGNVLRICEILETQQELNELAERL